MLRCWRVDGTDNRMPPSVYGRVLDRDLLLTFTAIAL